MGADSAAVTRAVLDAAARLLEPVLIEAAGVEHESIAQVRGWLWQATQTIAALPLDAPPWDDPDGA